MRSFAIVIVCYNRFEGIKRLLSSLERAEYEGRKDITLIFSIDNSGTSIVEDFAAQYKWQYGNKVVRTFPKRQGLKNHILQCGDYTNDYDIVTVLEDDTYVSDSFYSYAYHAAEFYWDCDNIAGISLYGFQKNWLNWLIRFEPQRMGEFDSYFLKLAQSWGEVWTGPKWCKFKEWYNGHKEFIKSGSLPDQLNKWPESSWLKYHYRYIIEENKYFVYPYVSLSTNYSDIGEHATFSVADHQVELQCGKRNYSFPKFNSKAVIYDEFCNRENLGEIVGIDCNDLCVDFWDTRKIHSNKRYLLTTVDKDYKVIKSYSLSLRSIELNVIYGVEGKGICLYDTTIAEKKRNKNGHYQLLLYSIRSHDETQLMKLALKLFLRNIWKRGTNKLRKKLKKR